MQCNLLIALFLRANPANGAVQEEICIYYDFPNIDTIFQLEPARIFIGSRSIPRPLAKSKQIVEVYIIPQVLGFGSTPVVLSIQFENLHVLCHLYINSTYTLKLSQKQNLDTIGQR